MGRQTDTMLYYYTVTGIFVKYLSESKGASMSTWAYTKSGMVVFAATTKLPSGVTFDDDFFCPSCRCHMYYKSASSNNRAAHFAGKHESWCDIGYTSDREGTVRDYSFTEETLPDFLSKIVSEGVKEPSVSKNKPSSKGTASKAPATTISRRATPKDIKTVRQLFNVLSSSLPEDELYPGIKVKDVYCGVNTQFLYTKFIKGLHLVYAEYNWFDKKTQKLFFRYPSIHHAQIKVICHVPNVELFNALSELLKGHFNKPVLEFATFSNSVCVIESPLQIVPLRG